MDYLHKVIGKIVKSIQNIEYDINTNNKKIQLLEEEIKELSLKNIDHEDKINYLYSRLEKNKYK
jgi:predicted  nucleic acid-binding Zn-ribbon protein